jgi:hypothetical protein
VLLIRLIMSDADKFKAYLKAQEDAAAQTKSVPN